MNNHWKSCLFAFVLLFTCLSGFSQTPTPQFSNIPYLKTEVTTLKTLDFGLGYLLPKGHIGLEASTGFFYKNLYGIGNSYDFGLTYYFRTEQNSFYLQSDILFFSLPRNKSGYTHKIPYSIPITAGYRILAKKGMWKFGLGMEARSRKLFTSATYAWRI